MANNSLTERVLSANERGLTVDEICAYENLPLEDVEHILRYWKSEYHAGTRGRQRKSMTSFAAVEPLACKSSSSVLVKRTGRQCTCTCRNRNGAAL
jgi:hypothetical protein